MKFKRLFKNLLFSILGLLSLIILIYLVYLIKWNVDSSKNEELLGKVAPFIENKGNPYRDLNKNGKFKSMYEPCHGSAPDIAGKNIANPLASILSFSMALRYSFDMDKEADMLDQAVKDVLKDGHRTQDIMEKGQKKVSTSEMGDLVISKLK